ncbi:hypothetical protein JCM33374_g5537 [Metschnikowia sp. JCM 33374]|nr:hypothetical protein JCM33374_g5537 [Metschnikowia sp. JCM 33374]
MLSNTVHSVHQELSMPVGSNTHVNDVWLDYIPFTTRLLVIPKTRPRMGHILRGAIHHQIPPFRQCPKQSVRIQKKINVKSTVLQVDSVPI